MRCPDCGRPLRGPAGVLCRPCTEVAAALGYTPTERVQMLAHYQPTLTEETP